MSPLPATASDLFQLLMPKAQPPSDSTSTTSFKAPSMCDEQREKQLESPTFDQILRRSVSASISHPNGGIGKTSQILNPPSLDKIDPFINHMPQFTNYDKIKFTFGTIFILPFRAILVILCFITAWILANIGMCGLTKSEIESNTTSHIKGWRRRLVDIYALLAYLCLCAAGFRIKIIGKQASREEAPILVGAPHSSFLEAVIMIMCGASPVSRVESRDAFIISTLQLFSQSIFVDRRTPAMRNRAKEDIKERVHSPDPELPQVFICPEGTNTNRRVLIQFKVGAFLPGVPVQPIAVRYPGHNRIDAITWTFKQSHTYLFSLWCLLSNPINHLEIEFMPVYYPNKEEQCQPELYAKNVQLVMAKALGISATDITYKKYYAEFCAMHNTVLVVDKKDRSGHKLENGKRINQSEHCGFNDAHHAENDEQKKDL